MVRLLSLSLGCLMAAEQTHAFASIGVLRRTPTCIPTMRRTVSVESDFEIATDVQEAVELLDEMCDDDDTEVQIQNDMPETEITKEDLMADIEDVMETVEDEITESSEGTQASAASAGLIGDIAKLFRVVKEMDEAVTAEEAAVSASLYMNPATEKIAQNLVISWEPSVAETLLRLEKVSNPNRPFMVGIVGIPGSGKSTSSEIVAALLGEDRAIVMPMDGFHLPLAELAELPNAADAIYRRGAPDTFDAKALSHNLARIAHGDEKIVTIPGFDHAVGDPTPDQHTFERDNHRIVICEGIYLLHDDDGWENVKSFFDWTIYIDADVDACIERLKERNKCIPGYTPEEIEVRCDAVDRVNAETSRDGAYKFASQIVSSGAQF